MLRFLREFERLHGVTVSQFDARRWESVLGEYDEDQVEMACALWLESFETADEFPTPGRLLETMRLLECEVDGTAQRDVRIG